MLKLKMFATALLVSLFAMGSLPAPAQLADKKALTLEAAKKIAAAAEAEAKKNSWNVVIAIVDDGGHLIYLQRMDGTQTGSVDVAIKKAQTAMTFKRPTKVFEDAVAGGRQGDPALHGALPIGGRCSRHRRRPDHRRHRRERRQVHRGRADRQGWRRRRRRAELNLRLEPRQACGAPRRAWAKSQPAPAVVQCAELRGFSLSVDRALESRSEVALDLLSQIVGQAVEARRALP